MNQPSMFPAAPAETIPAEFRTAFLAQRAAAARDRQPSLAARRADLHALHRLLAENHDALIDAVNRDYGIRSRFETRMTELLQCQDAAKDAIRRVKRWMRPQRRHLDITQYPLAKAWVFPQPVGVVGIVVPWNFPIAMAFQPLICALAAGNRVMIKMSENSNALALLLKDLIPQYFAADKLALFEDGGGRGPQFTQLPFDHLFFTGSPATGRAVMANCAANLTPVTLELGGKSPCIVAPDYPLREAARRIVWTKLLNAGQVCTSVDYLLLPEGSVDAFVDHARAVAASYYPNLENGDYSAIIDQRQYDRLQLLLEDARARGARLVPLLPDQPGNAARRILSPMLVLDVDDDMLIMRSEIFGPLLPVRTYRNRDEVVAYIGARYSPLAMYLYTRDRALERWYLEHTISGGVTVNDGMLHIGTPALPFGGVGHSGMGHYHGKEGFLTFSKLRPVFRQGPWRALNLLMPPYRGRAEKLLAFLLKRAG